MAKSPSITILEQDLSTYTVTSSSTILAVVGYATKGPVEEATFVTSRSDFEQKFGTPVEDSPYGSLAVYRAFNQGNQVIYYRVAENTAAKAAVAILNDTASTASYQEISTDGGPFGGLTAETTYSINVDFDNAGSPVDVNFTTGVDQTSFTLQEVVDIINDTIGASGTASIEGNNIRISSATTGDTSDVEIVDNDIAATGTGLIATADNTPALESAVAGTEFDETTTDNIVFEALESGSANNNLSVVKSSKTNPVDSSTIHKIEILYNNEVVETFDNISLTVADSNYFKSVINASSDNGGSTYVNVGVNDAETDGEITFENGTYSLGSGTNSGLAEVTSDLDALAATVTEAADYRVGTDGVPTDQEDEDALFVAALGTNADLANQEEYNYHILITPDNGSDVVQNAAITLAEYREDFLYIVDPPIGSDADTIVEWHNGTGRTNVLNSSYAALYWPWLKDYNPVAKEYIWCPPSVFIAEKLMEVDRNFAPWYAPAGNTRGKIIAYDYETSPSFGKREVMYGDLNAVNPFVNFSTKGLLVYGQKTLLRENSALNRVNVRRMVIYIKKLVKAAMDNILFEPHNPDTWRRASNKITNILEPIRQDNGLAEYQVVIDNSLNTPEVIQQSIMKGIIRLVPVGTVEIIEIKLQVNPSGSTLS